MLSVSIYTIAIQQLLIKIFNYYLIFSLLIVAYLQLEINAIDRKEEIKQHPKEPTKATSYSTDKIEGEDKEEKKPSTKKKVLALRSDVMNKNIFRALRRELKDSFETYLSHVLFFNPKSKRNFLNNVRKFADHLLEVTDSKNQEGYIDKSLLIKYLGILLNF